MSQADLKALAPVRQHREAQAERAWRQQRDLLREQEAALATARVRLQAAREHHAAQREALYHAHQGRALDMRALGAWNEQEHRLINELAEQTRALQALHDQQAQQAQAAADAEQRLRGCRRDLEKLKALMERLVEDTRDE